MKSSRRGFLRFAGLSAVGVAGSTAVATRIRASEEHEPPATEGKRLALVIDLRKFSKDDALLDKITTACHDAHNVPDFADDPKNEVKWIWTEDFETAFSRFIGTPEAVAVPSGRAGLRFIFEALGLEPGSEVICSAFGYPIVPFLVKSLGYDLRFVDCEMHTLGMDPDKLAEAISAGTIAGAASSSSIRAAGAGRRA